jgi:hypothetical protein
MHFPTLDKARKWIFGDAEQQKAAAGSLLELKARAGTAVFELSSAQVNEAINAFKRLGKVNMSLTEAVDFAIKHSRPDAGVISVDEAIEKALETKRSKRPSYVRDLRKRWSRFREWLPAAKRKALNTRSQLDVRRYLKNLFGLLVSRVKCWHRSCPPSSFSERLRSHSSSGGRSADPVGADPPQDDSVGDHRGS